MKYFIPVFLLCCCGMFCAGQVITPANPAAVCAPATVPLSVTGAGTGYGFQWMRDGADIPGQTSSNHNAAQTGLYKVRLTRPSLPDTVITASGISVTVNPLPAVPSFTIGTNGQCASLPFTFTVTPSLPGITYSWDFGDSQNGTGNPATHIYNAIGNNTSSFNVKVIATSSAGCTVNSATEAVSMLQTPNAFISDFNNTPAFTRCASTGSSTDFNLSIDNSSTTVATNTFYEINWGDSTTSFANASFSTTMSIPHTYTSLGFFTITHRVSGNNGCQNISKYTVYNGSNPGIGISSSGSTIQQCIPATDTFFIDTVRTRNNPPGTTYTISFNDGSADLIFIHPPPIFFVHTFSTSSCNASGAINPNSFYVRIRAQNPCGFLDGGVEPITTVTPPRANFSISPDTVACVNRIVAFSNTSVNGAVVTNSTCDNSTIINWEILPATGWTLSNGAFGNFSPTNNPATWGSQNLGITFTIPGNYTIKLIARNSANPGSPCRLDSVIKNVCITTSPTPGFTLDASDGCIPFSLNATNIAATPNSCTAATYKWIITYTPAFCGTSSAYAFTNGTDDTAANPSINFTNPGTYTITQRVTNACGTFTSSKTVDVKKPPTAIINLPTYSCGAVTIIPTATVVACGTNTATYTWTFTGGTPATSSTANPGPILFTAVGVHPISLSVSNECGTATATDTIFVTTAPDIVPTNDLALCGGLTAGPFNFTSTTGSPNYNWTNNNPSIGLPASGLGNIPAFQTVNAGVNPIIATIIVKPFVSSCNGVPDTFTVTVNPRPPAPVVTSPVTYCQNIIAALLTATPAGNNTLTWYSNAALTGGTATAPTPVTASVGSVLYYVTQSNSFNCISAASIITVNVNPSISGNTIGATQTICAGTAPATLASGTVTGGNGIFNYQWQKSVDGGTSWINVGFNNPDFLPGILTDTTAYRRIVTSTPVCPDTSNVITINVAGALNNFSISANQIICEGFIPAILNGDLPTGGGGNYHYVWQQLIGSTWTTVGGDVQNYQPSALNSTAQFRRVVNAAQCSATSNIITITVNPTPVASITALSNAICTYDHGTIIFSATTGTPGFGIELVLTKPGNTTDTIRQTMNDNGPVNITVIPVNSTVGNYSVQLIKITDSKGCEKLNSFPTTTISVKPLPVLILTNNSPICNGVSATLTASGADTYTWSPAASLNTNTGSTVTATPTATTTFTVRGTLNGCFKDTATIVTVIAGAVVANAGANQVLCNINTATLAANTPSVNATGGWRQVSGPVANITAIAQNTSTVTGLTAGNTYIFEWTITGQVPCPPTKDSVTIDILSPVINSIQNDTIICNGQSVTVLSNILSGGSSTGTNASYTYEWEAAPAGSINWQRITNETNAALSVTPTVSACYRRKVKTNLLCETISNSVCVTVNPAITNNVISTSQQVCVDVPVDNLIGNIPSGGDNSYVYSWETSTDSVIWDAVVTTVNYQPPTYTAAGIHYFRRDVASGNCTSVSNVVTIRVRPNAKAVFVSNPIKACAPFNLAPVIIVSVLPDSNATYNWYDDNGLFASNTTGSFSNYTIQNSGDTVNIKLVTLSPFGCKADSMQQQFVTYQTAVAHFIKDTSAGCGPLNVNFTNTTNVIDNSIQFFWDFGNGTTSNLPQPSTATYVQSPYYNDTTYLVTLKAYNGCDTTLWRDSVKVRSNPKARFGVVTTFGCSPFTVQIDNTSLGTPNTYYWDFGNGHKDTTFVNGPLQYTYNIGNAVDTFPIQLIAANECTRDTQVIIIRIAPNVIRPQVTINATDLFGCTPHIVAFNNATTGATTFIWNYGDGTVPDTTNSAQTTVLHTFNTPGIFTVAIQITNGCSDTTITRQVTVFAKPIAAFTTNAAMYCLGDTVRVNNNSRNASNYRWFWGDGQNSAGFEPAHVYSVAGNYTILVRAEKTNNSGIVCFDTAVQNITVLVRPDARVQSNINTVNCAPFILSATAPGIINEMVTWLINDTTVSPSLITSNGISTQYTFNNPGSFSVKMVAENALGCKDSSILTFTVRGTPVASFSPALITICTIDSTVAYLNTTTFNDNGPLSYRWLVDGVQQSTSGNFTFRYVTPLNTILPRIFTTQLIASNTVGCSDTAIGTLQMFPPAEARFNINNPADCVPFVTFITDASKYATSYQWLLNGVLADTTATPHIPITQALTAYTITLIADNIYGCTPDTFSINFTSRIKPTALFKLNDTLGCNGILNTVMTNQSTNATAYQWDWGDGTPGSTFTNPAHLYTTPGQYLVTLTASDAVCTDITNKLVTVATKPVVDFNVSDSLTCDTAHIQMINLTTGANSYLWTFSDGSTSTLQDPLQNFAPGAAAYSVKLVAYNLAGCKDSVTKANIIKAIPPPIADFFISPSPQITVPDYTFAFDNLTQDNIKYTYQWNLGDGRFANTRDIPPHKYADTGHYAVQLIVLDNNTGCPDTVTKIAIISGFPGYLYVPNAFYPNSVRNEFKTFKPVGKGLETYRLQIFDAWGKLLFETTQLDAAGSPVEGWDGTCKGNPVQQDAYAWRIVAKFRSGKQWDGMSYGYKVDGQKGITFGTFNLFR